ncbi:uncharacterized protein PV09_04045 [Verruconis gallopava]|uniref:Thioesterase domain-containing protein n=1 Tax=Verruconis gallopava TaxID=253628 RepID=A0A0D2B0H3_9PEZI|nr:uncharacterized protein PV09_04045 [Verruconis gallopava]KIW04864.1 hypothetical protein PV09_04045 [Verruconis gallopava]
MDEVNISDEQYFRSIPWCQQLLADPAFAITGLKSRKVKDSNEDACFAETFNTPGTIPHCLAMYRVPSEPVAMIDEVRVLYHVGAKLDGNPHILHGGIQSFLLDEAMAKIPSFNKDREGGLTRRLTVTASLQVSFRKVATTPAVLLASAKTERRQGRKLHLSSVLQDGNGQVLATAEGVFVTVEPTVEERL